MIRMRSIVGNAERNIGVIGQFLAEAASRDVDIVCFPEWGINGYNAGDTSSPEPEQIPEPSTDRLSEIAAGAGITFLALLPERDESGIVYNTQIVFDSGGIGGVYRKTHVAMAEIGTWCHGGALPVFNHPKARFGIEICYDSHFSEVSTALAVRGAEIISVPYASDGGTVDEKYARWLRYVPARAYDNGVFVAFCNHVGQSAQTVVDGIRIRRIDDCRHCGFWSIRLVSTVDRPRRVAEASNRPQPLTTQCHSGRQ